LTSICQVEGFDPKRSVECSEFTSIATDNVSVMEIVEQYWPCATIVVTHFDEDSVHLSIVSEGQCVPVQEIIDTLCTG
jgi:hypothetical protein